MEYRIGEFSHIVRLSVKTLRYYHDEGILEPAKVDRFTGYRHYDDASVERAGIISKLRELGFSIKEIREILAECTDDTEVVPYLQRRAEQIRRQIREYRTVEKRIQELIRFQESARRTPATEQVEEKQLPDLRIAGLRFRGKYSDVGRYIGPLMRAVAGAAASGPFTLYHDPEYLEDGADIEVCAVVRREVSHDEIGVRTLGGGRAVALVHHGPYTTIGESYGGLFAHCTARGVKPVVPFREHYLRGPGMIFPGNPKHWRTEIQMLFESD